MNNTIKFSLLAALLLTASTSFAAATAFTRGNAGTPVGQTSVDSTACPALKETIKVNLSTNSVGHYSCNAGAVGVATASYKGRGRYYGVNSSGGQVKETAAAGKYANQGAAEADTATEVAAQLTAAGT